MRCGGFGRLVAVVATTGLGLVALATAPAISWGAKPKVTISDVTTSSESGTADFTVTLSRKAPRAVKVDYATQDGNAVAPDDYASAQGTLKIKAGTKKGTVSADITADDLDESFETFKMKLSNPRRARIADGAGTATIADDDPTPSLTVAGGQVSEGDSGNKADSFTFTLSHASGRQVQVQYATNHDNVGAHPATENTDYVPLSLATLTFQPGDTQKQVDVSVIGDLADEPNETFILNLFNPDGATFGNGDDFTGLIVDDDPTPGPTVLNETDAAGEADFCNIAFPATMTVGANTQTQSIFGQVFEDDGGVNTANPGADPAVTAQVGVGPSGTNPATDAGWSYTTASFNVQQTSNDEYSASLTAPAAGGTYAYVFRFSFDGGQSVTYCDLNGAGSNSGNTFEPATQLGVMTVTP